MIKTIKYLEIIASEEELKELYKAQYDVMLSTKSSKEGKKFAETVMITIARILKHKYNTNI